MPKTFENFIVDTSDVQKKINKIKTALNDPSGVFAKVLSDMKRRSPGKVADAVRETYNIKKSEIMPSNKKNSLKKAGIVKITGQEIANLTFKYEGRVLTPLHFGVTPKTKPLHGKKYKIKFNVKKKLKAVKSPTKEGKIPFLAPARNGNARIIPWLRDVDGTIEPMRTLSLPQMIDNKKVREKIDKDLGGLLQERLDHHLNQYLSK